MVNSVLNSFDVWTDAQGVKSKGRVKSIENISLEGITRLRELILNLAIRGKLVNQDANDEPASELLKRIDNERAQIAKDGRLKREKKSSDIPDKDKPFELPKNWSWVKLEQVIQISSGDGLTAAQMNSDGDVPVFGGNGINGYHDEANVKKPTLVIGRVGFYCGSIHITPSSAWVTDNAFITSFSESNIYLNFLYWLLKGTNLKENDSATAQPVISGRKVYPIVVGLPPLAEQKRIVAKVDALMALCDKLENEQTAHLKTHQALVKTLLQTLTGAKDADDLHEAWQRIASHFDTLFCTEDSIDQLKQTILQLAITGRLVKQDPNDEPASELIKRIEKEKAKLVKEGKLKKEKALPSTTPNERHFDLPEEWVWCRLGDFTINVDYGTSEKATEKGEVPILRMGNVQEGKVLLDNLKFVQRAIKDLPRLFLKSRDLIFNRTNSFELVGKCGIFRGRDDEYTLASYLIRISVPHNFISVDYLSYYINSNFCRKTQIEPQITQQTGQANFSGSKLKEILLPLPSFAEQNRIVSKMDQLLGSCDLLKTKIDNARKIKISLSKSIVENAVA